MPYVFYQNIRNFGGRSAARNIAFTVGLNLINRGIAVAAFSEILNNKRKLQVELQNLALQLYPGLTSLVVTFVGQTAVGRRVEYIGIAWDPTAITVQHVGQVLRVETGWEAFNTPAPVPLLIEEPAGVALDQRGMAYIAGHDAANNLYIFAFVHNQYAVGDIYAQLGGLKSAINSILHALLGYATYDPQHAVYRPVANLKIIVGGDFNVRPHDLTSRGVPMRALKAIDGAGRAIPTTATRPIDWWLSNDRQVTVPVANAACAVWAQTRDYPGGLQSDHAGISLQY